MAIRVGLIGTGNCGSLALRQLIEDARFELTGGVLGGQSWQGCRRAGPAGPRHRCERRRRTRRDHRRRAVPDRRQGRRALGSRNGDHNNYAAILALVTGKGTYRTP